MILVLSVGRSGTSEVAEILIKQGVDMGSRHNKGDEFNPKGYFEDNDFQELNSMFFLMGLDKNQRHINIWRKRFKELTNKKEPWGLKDPGIADSSVLLKEYLSLNPKVILCTRDRESTIKSFMRMKGIERKKAEVIYDRRLTNLKVLKDYLEIDCYDNEKSIKVSQIYTKSLVRRNATIPERP